MAEFRARGLSTDGDSHYLELMFLMSEGGHREETNELLALTIPETEEFSSSATTLVVRLVDIGCEDMGYNLVQFIMDKNNEEGGHEVNEELLKQIVRCVKNNMLCF